MYFRKDTLLNFNKLKFYYFMLLVFIHFASSSEIISYELEQTNASQNDNSTSCTKCPLWHYYDPSTNSCLCFPCVLCDEKKAYIDRWYMVTVQQNQNLVSISRSNIFYLHHGAKGTKPGYRLLPENISELNDYMCGPLNRKGYLCSDCIDGFGPSMSIFEHPNDCYRCRDNWHGVILYLIIVLVPVTLFYLIILIFQINMASAPMPCFIMYSQIVSIALSDAWSNFGLSEIAFNTNTGDITPVTKLILILYGIFNLDFMSHVVPPFCIISNLSLYHRAILGYIKAFYPMLLILMTWICVELHDRNFRMIVYLWRPFHRCFVRLRRGWDTKNDLINVFATFLLLSFINITYQTVIITTTTKISTYSLSGECFYHSNYYYVSEIDNIIMTNSTNYITWSFLAALICIIFNIIPLLLLVLYQFEKFRKLLSKLRLDGISLMIFMEKFHCCYRDGLDGRRDMRYFSGIYYLLSLLLSLCPVLLYDMFKFKHYFVRGIIFSITAPVIALCRPHKKEYMNVCDTLLLSHLALICFMPSQQEMKYFVPFTQALILLPFAVLGFVICLKILCKTRRSHIIKSLHLSRYLPNCLKAAVHDSCVNPKEPETVRSLHSYGAIN